MTTIRFAQLPDLDKLVTILQQGLAGPRASYMPIMQTGSRSYIKEILSGMSSRTDQAPRNDQIRVAVDQGNRLEGVIIYRAIGLREIHLAYLVVNQSAQRSGVGHRLMEDLYSHSPNEGFISLNVFTDNFSAIKLYGQHGFREVSDRQWLTRALPDATEPASIQGKTESERTHAERGFSLMTIDTGDFIAKVGRLGSSVINCTDLGHYRDDGLLSRIRGAYPGLTHAFTATGDAQDGPHCAHGERCVGVSRRMERATHEEPAEQQKPFALSDNIVAQYGRQHGDWGLR